MAIFPNWPLETWPEYLSGWEPHHLLHGRRVPRRWRAPGIAGQDNSSITALHGSESCHSISLSSFATLLCAVAEIWATWPVLLATISLGHLAQVTQVDSVCIYLLIDKLREPPASQTWNWTANRIIEQPLWSNTMVRALEQTRFNASGQNHDLEKFIF